MLSLDYPFKKEILACGTNDFSGICLTKKNCGYLYTKLDRKNGESYFDAYKREVSRIKTELKIKPKIIAHDLHTEYASTQFAHTLMQGSKTLKTYPVQHHHAHIASCIAENNIEENVIAVVLDNPGFGEDGNFWGWEFFTGNLHRFNRKAHAAYTPLGKEENSNYTPWKLAVHYLLDVYGESFRDLNIDFLRRHRHELHTINVSDDSKVTLSSSAGSLFDAMSALIGVRERLEYRGQGSIELERIINRSSHVANKSYECEVKNSKDVAIIELESLIKGIVDDLKNNISKSIISAAFHNTLIDTSRQMCSKIRKKEKIDKVVLTGSIFSNKVLLNGLKEALTANGFSVATHTHMNCDDSNVSFGQAIIANTKK